MQVIFLAQKGDGSHNFVAGNTSLILWASIPNISTREANETIKFDTVKPVILETITTDPLCNNGKGSLSIKTVVGGTPPYSYSIDNGKSFFSYKDFIGLDPGIYLIKIKDSEGCEDKSSIIINNPPKLSLNVNPINKVDIGEDVQLLVTAYPTIPAIKTITWSPDSMLSCNNCLNPSISKPLQNIYFTIKIESENGCKAETYATVDVDKGIDIFAPNYFSPNRDGQNDRFMLFGKPELVVCIKWLRVYDRWGDNVFSETNIKVNDVGRGWDGKLAGQDMNPAVFVWAAEVEFIDGAVKILKGNLNLVR